MPEKDDTASRPSVVALVGSPRRQGNTVYAVGVVAEELERRGVSCRTVMLCDVTMVSAKPTRATTSSEAPRTPPRRSSTGSGTPTA